MPMPMPLPPPTEIVDITTSNPVIVDLSKDFETSNSFNDSPRMDMVNTLAASYPNTRIVTVIQNGKIVGEYVRDDDVDPTQLRPIYSVTKAVSGMLFGILVDQYGTSINTTLGEFFPNETDWNLVDDESTVDYMKSLSAYEILTMTTGLYPDSCVMNGLGNCTGALGGGDLQSTLAWPVIDKEGELTVLTPRELLAAEILPAIGIEDADVEWPLDADAALGESFEIEPAHGGMNLTTKQMAKIGQLVIQKGLAAPNGTHILSSEWIETSLSLEIPIPVGNPDPNPLYGYQQWYHAKSEEFGDSYVSAGFWAGVSDNMSDSTLDPVFDCTNCPWFLPLLKEGPDFFVPTNSSNNSSPSPPPTEKEDNKEEGGNDNSDSSNSAGIIPAPQLMVWGFIACMFAITSSFSG
ncbi:hypothetical protein FRACYDRAFT_250830 [Fragilariopsis cylindrus CCMP1102]|uniref:Beta-lactamase/transpeptidase-like protein n=1 Tax=Fragilariopsis cylindrus CCMP1102 TaxID=635003 RepID=A0A1E7EPM5_9STRA|nr:hypothetical protein FRACYDRAFT_250830 [Fragilariopsis cylindrus CCMP1102]|eukprot:OEU07804.1 hypothetical protein FRACYDRAFT_250830 [Fragilariopsis cylindrus CCMP1102]